VEVLWRRHVDLVRRLGFIWHTLRPTLDAGVDRARRLSQCFWSWVVDVEVDVEEEEALGAKDAAMIGRR
jgi:hypothetical protein